MLDQASRLLADIPPEPRTFPQEIQQSTTGMIIAGIAVAVGVVLLGMWLVGRKSRKE